MMLVKDTLKVAKADLCAVNFENDLLKKDITALPEQGRT